MLHANRVVVVLKECGLNIFRLSLNSLPLTYNSKRHEKVF